jgi:ABC-type multidrug transport system ATPase subunit
MRSAVGIVIGLAARAELTVADEPYAGLDAVARQLFYDRCWPTSPSIRAPWCCPPI